LRAGQTALANLRDVEIADSRLHGLAREQYVGTLDVPVEDIKAVEGTQSEEKLDGDSPNFFLRDALLLPLMLFDVGCEVAARGELRNEDKRVVGFVVEGLLVGEHVGIGDAGENAHLVETVGDFT
jgi:hypothetical protein